jgi:hypothetical protein
VFLFLVVIVIAFIAFHIELHPTSYNLLALAKYGRPALLDELLRLIFALGSATPVAATVVTG